MKLYCLKEKALDMLEKDIPNNLEKYAEKDRWVDQYFLENNMTKYWFDSDIDVKDYELVLGGPETDFQNAKILFEAMQGRLNRVQASDLRLWAYLAHVQHWDYMNERWGIDVPDQDDSEDNLKDNEEKSIYDKPANRVKSRFFFERSRGKAFGRQGIARLYWGALLTYDSENEDPYEYTEYLFGQEEIYTSIMERSYARSPDFVLAILKELKKAPGLSRKERREYLKRLNQAGAITVIDALDKQQAEELCKINMLR